MKISAKGRYAVRVMVDLAVHSDEGYQNVKQIAERQGISEKYLEQIIAVLNKANFVTSVRGAQGGYKLSDLPENITVGMILRLTEGSLSPVACVNSIEEGECTRCVQCETIDVWKDLADAINQVVDSFTIAELARKQLERSTGNKKL